jgi:hypothetical protein
MTGGSASAGKGLWIGVGVGAGVLLLGAVVTVLFLHGGAGTGGPGDSPANSKPRGGGGAGGPENNPAGRKPEAGTLAGMIAYLPNDTFRAEYADVKAQRQAFGNDRSRIRVGGVKVDDLQRDFGSPDNVEAVLYGMRSGDSTRGQTVLVVRCSGPIDRARLTAGGKEMEARGKKYYEMKPNKDAPGFGGKVLGEYLHFPSENVMVRADTQLLATEVIGGDGGRLPEAFKGLLAEAGGHQNVVLKEKGGPVLARLESKTWSG